MTSASASRAARLLDAAFAAGARGVVPAAGRPVLGVFGSDFPLPLAAACGLAPVDVELEPAADRDLHSAAVERCVEPFADRGSRRFLHRLACGAFADFAAIVFTRATPAAYHAFLYATELVRQSIVGDAPALLLGNLQLTRSAAASAFNRAEALRLAGEFQRVGGDIWTHDRLEFEVEGERARRTALAALARDRSRGKISGAVAMRWRNTGRFMSAHEHARLLERALSEVPAATRATGPRVGICGCAVADPQFHELVGDFGSIVADVQPLGDAWPPPCPAPGSGLDGLLAATAANALHPRSLPVDVHREAIAGALLEAGSEVAIFQLDEHDDCFGWDMPAIRASLHTAGVATVDLGFRPDEPGADWWAGARAQLAEAILAASRGPRR